MLLACHKMSFQDSCSHVCVSDMQVCDVCMYVKCVCVCVMCVHVYYMCVVCGGVYESYVNANVWIYMCVVMCMCRIRVCI